MPDRSVKASARFVSRTRELRFGAPREVIVAQHPGAVWPALERIRAGVGAGLHAAGYIAYEAAPAFDPAFDVHDPGPQPVLWFGLFDAPRELAPPPRHAGAAPIGPWRRMVSEEAYRAAVGQIRNWIARGHTYQANYTFPIEAAFPGRTEPWFEQLWAAQRCDYAAWIDTGRYHIVSASPELFFALEGSRITARPMKGTRPRGLWASADRDLAGDLQASAKDRAENVMIVDLIRNDLGRIAKTGTVRATSLFDVEQYESVWQMTSTVTAETDADVPEVLGALFPCGSVTGAPKVRTMEIIRGLEPHPRGMYCGAIGWWAPGRRATFSVAIRTAVVDTAEGRVRYHVGSGITWDSRDAAEYTECLDKAAILTRATPPFSLLESILFDGQWVLLDAHLDRIMESARYFAIPFDRGAVHAHALGLAAQWTAEPQAPPRKVRLVVSQDGAVSWEDVPIGPPARVRVGFAQHPVDPANRFLYHKTTHREPYVLAKASRPDCEDVVLWNARGEITESATANVVLELDGQWWTPPVACGLLAGTYRAQLLADGVIRERILTKDDVARATGLRLINSVRGWIETEWIDQDSGINVRRSHA